jgi:hypothetical protein
VIRDKQAQMAKKSSKKQPKQPNDTSLTVDMGTVTAAKIKFPEDTSAPTRVAFREFIELADLNAIKVFITTASSSPEGENLKLLWGRAFKEGLIAGHQLYGKTEERMKEIHVDAYEEGFQAGYNEGRRDEYGDWAIDGHGMHCGYQATIPCDDYGTQIEPATSSIITENSPRTTVTVSTQTDPLTVEKFLSNVTKPVTATFSVQTDTPTARLPLTASISIQTSPWMPENSKNVSFSPKKSPSLAAEVEEKSQTQTVKRLHYESTVSYDNPSTQNESPSCKTTQNHTKTIELDFTGEISSNIPVFSSITPSVISPDSTRPSTTTTALEMRSTTAGFTQKVEKVEISDISTQAISLATPTLDYASPSPSITPTSSPAPTTIEAGLETRPETTSFIENQNVKKSAIFTKTALETPASSATGLKNDTMQVHTTQPTPSDVFSQPTATSTTSSSSQPPSPPGTGHQKSVLLRDVSQSESPIEFLASTPIISAFKTRPESAIFVENCKKVEITPHLAQNHPETLKPPVSKRFNWADEAGSLPISTTLPQHPPRDLSGLRSTSTDPFSSLRRRHGHPKRRRKTPQQRRGYWHSYPLESFPALHRSPRPNIPFRLGAFTSLDCQWDQDPRLADLSNALRALGWARR